MNLISLCYVIIMIALVKKVTYVNKFRTAIINKVMAYQVLGNRNCPWKSCKWNIMKVFANIA